MGRDDSYLSCSLLMCTVVNYFPIFQFHASCSHGVRNRYPVAILCTGILLRKFAEMKDLCTEGY